MLAPLHEGQSFSFPPCIIWHLPFFKALAKTSEKKKIHLFTIKTTLAKEILKYDEIIDKIHYLNETREFFNTIQNFPKIIRILKKEKIQTIWIFHRSPRYAIIARLATVVSQIEELILMFCYPK